MKDTRKITKAALVGGAPVILPIYIVALLLAKAVNGLLALLAPIPAQAPVGVAFHQVLPSCCWSLLASSSA